MLTVVSDTHAADDHCLSGRTLAAVRDASFVVHAGDFLTAAVLDAFVEEAGRFAGVVGNNDTKALRDRLPARRTVESDGIRLVVVHGHEHTDTALTMLGRQEGADLVVVGHSHRPGFHDEGEVPVLNPGSHAQPRRYRPAHAELEREGDDGPIRGRLVEPNGTVFEDFCIEE